MTNIYNITILLLQYLGEKGPKKSQKGAISWILNQYKKPWKFFTSQPHMLYWWNLPQTYILIKLNTSKTCTISDASSCLSSLVKNVRCFWSSCQKSTQKQRKTTVSAGTKKFQNLKLENCRFHISKTCPVCVPPGHLSFTENWGCQSNEVQQRVHPKKSQEFIKILTLIALKNSL